MNPISGTWTLPEQLDVAGNTSMTRTGAADPTGFFRDGRWWRATRFATGPATVAYWQRGKTLHGEAWGPGAEAALAALPALVGADDDVSGFDPTLHPVVHDAYKAWPGMRLGRSDAIFETAVPVILGQKVTGLQAKRSFHALVRMVDERAPLDRVSRRPLFLPPSPQQVLAALAGHGATSIGIDITRATTLREVALVAHHVESATDVKAMLQDIPGVGVWTANMISLIACGDADAVPAGDYHFKNHVAFALANEPRGTDERMLELLEPFRPHRGRALRYVLASGRSAPKYGPRMSVPSHVPFTSPRASRGAAASSRSSKSPRRAR